MSYAADVERRATEVRATTPEIKKEAPLCPICLKVGHTTIVIRAAS